MWYANYARSITIIIFMTIYLIRLPFSQVIYFLKTLESLLMSFIHYSLLLKPYDLAREQLFPFTSMFKRFFYKVFVIPRICGEKR